MTSRLLFFFLFVAACQSPPPAPPIDAPTSAATQLDALRAAAARAEASERWVRVEVAVTALGQITDDPSFAPRIERAKRHQKISAALVEAEHFLNIAAHDDARSSLRALTNRSDLTERERQRLDALQTRLVPPDL